MEYQTNFEQLPTEKQFELLQKTYHDFIRIKTGDALVNSQYVEFMLKILCELTRPLGIRINPDDIMSGKEYKKTLGQLKQVLVSADILKDDFIERLSNYVVNRNKFVHGLYFQTFNRKGNPEAVESPESKGYIEFCSNLVEEGAYIVETITGMYAAFARTFNADAKSSELDELLASFAEFLPDAHEALKDDFEVRMKKSGALPDKP